MVTSIIKFLSQKLHVSHFSSVERTVFLKQNFKHYFLIFYGLMNELSGN